MIKNVVILVKASPYKIFSKCEYRFRDKNLNIAVFRKKEVFTVGLY